MPKQSWDRDEIIEVLYNALNELVEECEDLDEEDYPALATAREAMTIAE